MKATRVGEQRLVKILDKTLNYVIYKLTVITHPIYFSLTLDFKLRYAKLN